MVPFEATSSEERHGKEGLAITADLAAKLNLADFQNAVPLIRELNVVNGTASKAGSLELSLRADPPFLKARTWHLDSVAPLQKLRIQDLDVVLDGSVFIRLTEAEPAILHFELRGEEVLATHEQEVELLPRNQWGGMSQLPELLAAFVQPNDPVVEQILKQAAEWLRSQGKSSALDGYRGGAKRAWELTSAIWRALASLKLDYALPPASFEQTGQKVRGPSQIQESGLATCLDLTLLACACLEQAGLNPLILLSQGHAYAGVWLRAEEFSTTVVDDVTALRKRIALQEMILFEATLLTGQTIPPFAHAVQVGAQHVCEAEEAQFQLAIDIRRARLHRIKPLASEEATTVFERSMPGTALDLPEEEVPDLPEEVDLPEPVSAEIDTRDRLARWQRKLLDLSLRNNLLNFKETKKTLKLEVPDPGALVDLLVEKEALKLLPLPALMTGADPREQLIHEGREHERLREAHAREALQRKEVFIGLSQDEMEGRLVEQYRAAKAALQEGGANTLFLAFGFLSWSRADRLSQRLRAPLVLVPVTLDRRSIRSGFTLRLHEDEARFNPTLLEMLRQDFNLNLGIPEKELDLGEDGQDIPSLWRAVERAVKDIPGWEVRHEVSLALFSFAKYLMWKDLTERTDQLRESPVVRHLLDTPREAYPSDMEFPELASLDRTFGPEQVFCPLQADSSQLSAVLAASRGKDFVLIGPPGTGKSQTIANLVAQCIAEGKKVLFVSEKMAALDVVHRRLKEVGLGEFCLELHSNKTNKQEVLDRLQTAWGAKGSVDSETWNAEAGRLRGLREELNVYVQRLHKVHRNGLTIFEAIAQVASGEDLPHLGLAWSSPDIHDRKDLEGLRDLVTRLEVNAGAVGSLVASGHPLTAVACADWSPIWQRRLVQAALLLADTAKNIQETAEAFLGDLALPPVPLGRHGRSGLEALARILPGAHGRDWRFTLRPGAHGLAERLEAALALLARHRSLTERLSPAWPEEVVRACNKGLSLLSRRRDLKAKLGAGFHPEVTDDLRKGLGFLEALGQEERKLSVRYTEGVESLEIHSLQRTWIEGETKPWPLSWLRKRRVTKALLAVAHGEGRLEPGQDVRILARMRDLHAQVADLDLGPATDGIWNGRRTNLRNGNTAVRFQAVLVQARQDLGWEDKGFEPIAEGRCGERLAQQLSLLREIVALDGEIASLAGLEVATSGLWAGLATREEALMAALSFHSEREDIRSGGAPTRSHDLVAMGECGQVLAADLQVLLERAQVEARMADHGDLSEATQGLWAGLRTNLTEGTQALAFLGEVTRAIAALAGSLESGQVIKTRLEALLGEGNHLLDPGGRAMARGREFIGSLGPLPGAIREIGALGALRPEAQTRLEESTPGDLEAWGRALVGAEPRIHAWCAWQKVCQEGEAAGLGPLIRAIEGGLLAGARIRPGFETDYCRWWLNASVDQDEVIRRFVSAEHERRIQDFRELDRRFTALTRDWIRASLCSRIPDAERLPRDLDWGLLRREMAKKRKHLPLRTLLADCPRAITSLAPCLLMSPLSIAQYLAAGTEAFDVVVFDEASQIPVWDAIGAIARGRQVVMVGDPKQLPPTNFFNRADADPEDLDVEEDLESILDECIGASLPTLDLTWHYRSRHESLIAFSNHHYYHDRLITFPSPVTRDNAVSFHFVEGLYERGGARQNKPEARALVEDVVGRLRSPEFRKSGQTIGIVTFNAEQQILIENLLDEARRKNPVIESHFSDSQLEPVFVKNLESVQGDERDIIYFSITYGPDHTGVPTMNFGPLNRDGGERRLNVAITRARQELRVFSSLRSEQINLARTQARGAKDLKHFLDYAERGARALAEEARVDREDFDSPFEEAVSNALERKGWTVRTQVGVSAFRIDLAVVHPDFPGAFLAGVECDGATYHRSATARDRDLLREQVLRRLGWEILRVWSTDWWIDPAGTLEVLHRKLEEVLELSRAQRAVPPAPPEDLPREPLQAPESLEEPSGEEEAKTVMRGHDEDHPVSIDPEVFFGRTYDTTLAWMIGEIVEAEGPILDAVLARRIARKHGWQRTGTRIQHRVETVAARNHKSTTENVGKFFWPNALEPGGEVPPRKQWNILDRSVDEICLQELVALAREVQRFGKRDALTLMARSLGLGRVTSSTRERLEAALDVLEEEAEVPEQ